MSGIWKIITHIMKQENTPTPENQPICSLYHHLCYANLDSKKPIMTKLQVTQRAMERFMMGISLRDKK